MVQVVENQATVTGEVQAVEPAGDSVAVTLRVERADPVPGVANLLQDVVGETITLSLLAKDAAPRPGDQIRCQARLAGPGRYFAIPGTVQPA